MGGKPVFLSYLPAGSYVGEMALIDGGQRTATVRAAIKSEVIKIDGEAFGRVLAAKPALLAAREGRHGNPPRHQCLRRIEEGRLLRRRRSLFGAGQVPRFATDWAKRPTCC